MDMNGMGTHDAGLRGFDEQLRRESELTRAIVNGRYNSRERDDGRDVSSMLTEADMCVIRRYLDTINIACVAHIATMNKSGALDAIRSGAYLATDNSGFAFENDTFRLAAYCWNPPEGDDGYQVIPHNFWHKRSGVFIDWYKHFGRGMWASDSFVSIYDNHVCAQNGSTERLSLDCIMSALQTDCIKSLTRPNGGNATDSI